MSTLLLLVALAGAPDAVNDGRRVFHDASVGTNGVACANCHATVADEDKDGDGLVRAGHTLAGVARRGHWRGDLKRKRYATLAEGVDECVKLFQGGDGLVGRNKTNLVAYLGSISKKAKARPDLDTGLMPNLDYDRRQYKGGDADSGRALFFAACHSCHPSGRAGLGPTLTKSTVADVARKTREGNGLLRGSREPGQWMPSFGRERLTDEQLAAIAAYVITLRE